MVSLFNLLFPQTCFICGELSDDLLCDRCRGEVRIIFPGPEYIGECRDCDRVYSVFEYGELLKMLLTRIKFQRDIVAAYNLGRLVGREIRGKIDFSLYHYLVPVPSSRGRLRKRLFHQTFEMIRGVRREVVLPSILRIAKVRDVRSQVGLGLEERRENVRGAFDLPEKFPDLEGKRVLIFDDLFTTGSTVGEVASLLKKKGRVEKVDVLTCCRGAFSQEGEDSSCNKCV